MTRLVLLALVCLAGCSGPALQAAPSEITSATLREVVSEQSFVRLPSADARAIYAALKADEPHIIDAHGYYAWEPHYIIAFHTRGSGVIEVGLHSAFELWMPMGVPYKGDRDVPEDARATLSRYVEPL